MGNLELHGYDSDALVGTKVASFDLTLLLTMLSVLGFATKAVKVLFPRFISI